MDENCNQAPLRTTPNTKYTYGNSTSKSILEEARGHWIDILKLNGVDEGYLKKTHGPCPACGGKDRFRFDNKEQRGTFFCNKCGAGDGVKLLQLVNACNFPIALAMVSKTLGFRVNQYYSEPKHVSRYLGQIFQGCEENLINNEEVAKRRRRLNTIWRASRPIIIGDPVQCYLTSRGFALNSFPTVLRHHPALPYYEGRTLVGQFPAMLAIVKDQHNNGVTIHRTYLGQGCKANVNQPKKLMPPIMPNATRGAAVRLYEPQDGVLAVAEGIENALAFYLATKIPIWSAISAGGMERIILPATVKDVVIAVDNDSSGRGQKAAIILSNRLLAEGRKVRRAMPPKVDSDFADLLLDGCQ